MTVPGIARSCQKAEGKHLRRMDEASMRAVRRKMKFRVIALEDFDYLVCFNKTLRH
jgi:hypothetical protein